MDYQYEQTEWNTLVEREVGRNAKLISVSVFCSDCRVYSFGESIFKLRRFTPASIRGRINSLEDEFIILSHLSSMPGIPKALKYKRLKEWELLQITTLSIFPPYDPTFGRPRESFYEFIKIVKFVWSLNMLGCSHGDLHFENIGQNIEGSTSCFDFDQAVLAHPVLCFFRDFIGFGAHARINDFSLFSRLRNVQVIWLIFSAMKFLKKIIVCYLGKYQPFIGLSQLNNNRLKERVSLLSDSNLNTLAEAWDIAASSNASAPGVRLSYYSLDISGVHFPGERSWHIRWNIISTSIDFKNKNILELGCNLGLLSTHLKLNGARSCFGIDADEKIINAASMVATAFEVDIQFLNLNLDSLHSWENQLNGFDMVFALSVMHWVNDKKRLWTFLGRQNEVIYEGHETSYEAEENLLNVGFKHIYKIGLSDRGRYIFYASK